MTKAVTDAVKGDINSVNKWQTAGNTVREFYGSESAIVEVKAQFMADAIVPAINPAHAKALAKDLPRKGSKEYADFVTNHGADAWESANQAKKDARSVRDTMFNRVVSYAFPKTPTEKTITPTKTKLVELINDAIKRAQKDETPDYDVSTLIAHLSNALTIVK